LAGRTIATVAARAGAAPSSKTKDRMVRASRPTGKAVQGARRNARADPA
jgi:hypothetical protein